MRRGAHGRVRWSAAIWWQAVSDGAFYNRWSAALSFLLAALVGVPTIENASLEGYLKAVAVSVCGWVVLAALMLPVAFAERRVRSRTARGILVLAALLVATSIRAPLNDAMSVWFWQVHSAGTFGPRVFTNIMSGLALFSLVAIARSQYARRRAIAARLDGALAPMHTRLQRAREQAAVTTDLVSASVDRLRTARDEMLAGVVDFDAVRAYAEEVREESHRFEARARAVDDESAIPEAVVAIRERRRSLSERLVPTPWLMIALIYTIATLPFSVAAGGWTVGLLGVVGVSAIDAVANAAVRWAIPKPGARSRPALFLGVWVPAGVAVAAWTVTLLPNIGMVAYVGIITIPGLVLVGSLCVDAMQVAQAAAESSERLLTPAARYVAEQTARVTDPLRQAVSLLHGQVQGRCVILAAHADEQPPTPQQLAEFRERTDDAFARMLGPVSEQEVERGSLDRAPGPLERIVAAWRAVMDITVRTDADAAAVLTDREISEEAADVVNEALVNAVKHSGARVARVSLGVADAGRIRVTVASPGILSDEGRRGTGIGMRRPDVWIRQSGADVVLEAVVPDATAAMRTARPAP